MGGQSLRGNLPALKSTNETLWETSSKEMLKEMLNETTVAQLINSDNMLKSSGFLASQNSAIDTPSLNVNGSTSGEEYMQAAAMSGPDCCRDCWPDFCSPVSGNCYVMKKKNYYLDCREENSCCTGCQGSSYCSPVSGTCYAWKNKDYYKSCN